QRLSPSGMPGLHSGPDFSGETIAGQASAVTSLPYTIKCNSALTLYVSGFSYECSVTATVPSPLGFIPSTLLPSPKSKSADANTAPPLALALAVKLNFILSLSSSAGFNTTQLNTGAGGTVT